MSEPFLSEIRIVGFQFAPRGWAYCDGQILPINQNQSLYSLLGTRYGGDGRTTFALPDLRGRTPLHRGDGFALGQKAGSETVTLTTAELAYHSHAAKGTSADADSGQVGLTASRAFATVPPIEPGDIIYGEPSSLTALGAGLLPKAGGSQAHDNMQPYLTLGFCIALKGLFPSRN